jgi:hypothetical protein
VQGGGMSGGADGSGATDQAVAISRRVGKGSSRFYHWLTLATKDVIVIILALAADITGVSLLWCGGWRVLGTEPALAPVRHESVHQQVKLDRAIVGGECGRQEVEVVVEDVHKLGAVGKPPALKLLTQVIINVVPVASVDEEVVHVASLVGGVSLDVEAGLEGGINR